MTTALSMADAIRREFLKLAFLQRRFALAYDELGRDARLPFNRRYMVLARAEDCEDLAQEYEREAERVAARFTLEPVVCLRAARS